MKKIPLTLGMFALVDTKDFPFLSRWKWRALRNRRLDDGFRAAATIGGRMVLMHRLLMKPPVGWVVDHRNGDTLDNRRKNLRVCRQEENVRNAQPWKKGSSKFKGVGRHNGKWRARIQFGDQPFFLGHFKTEKEAARAYNVAAKKFFGKFAYLNKL